MSDEDVERYEIDEQPDEINEPDVILVAGKTEDETQGELIKFAILAVVLLGAAVVIGLLRPIIFDRIVPAILGEGQPSAIIINTEAEAETIKPSTEENTETTGDAAPNAEDADTAESSETEAPEVTDDPVNPADFPTAVPAQTHTVQPGETLTAIAQQYGVTVQAIVEANQISNPNRVDAGTVLTIPEGQ
jgi:LysM repeat protein